MYISSSKSMEQRHRTTKSLDESLKPRKQQKSVKIMSSLKEVAHHKTSVDSQFQLFWSSALCNNYS